MFFKIKPVVKSSVPVIFAVFAVGAIVFAWTEPSVTPPNPDPNVAIPLNSGSTGQSKKGNLALNTDGILAYGLLVPFGNVGIGTATPAAKLDVAGDINADMFSVKLKKTSSSDTAQYSTNNTSWTTVKTFNFSISELRTTKILNFKAQISVFSFYNYGGILRLVSSSGTQLGSSVSVIPSDGWKSVGISLSETDLGALENSGNITIRAQLSTGGSNTTVYVRDQELTLVYNPATFNQASTFDGNTYNELAANINWQTVKTFSFPVAGDRIIKKIALNAELDSYNSGWPFGGATGRIRMVSGYDNYSQLGSEQSVFTPYGGSWQSIPAIIVLDSGANNALSLSSNGSIVILIQLKADNVNIGTSVKNISLEILHTDGLVDILSP